jgi:hypothetical protein
MRGVGGWATVRGYTGALGVVRGFRRCYGALRLGVVRGFRRSYRGLRFGGCRSGGSR